MNELDYETMQAHPYADLFPMMSDEAIKAIADDISQQGLLVPIITFEGKILDGRNRRIACKIAGVTPTYEEYSGNNPLGFVVAHNLHHRHLTESQRAMVAAKLANMQSGSRNDLASIDARSVSQPAAAAMLNVSRPSVQRAKAVVEHGTDELNNLVTTGQVSVNAGSYFAKLPQAEQAAITAGGAEAVKAKATEIRKETNQKRADELAEPEPLVVDGVEEARKRRLIKITHDEALHICSTAISIMDRINKKDTQRVEALREMIDYCQQRISQNQ